MAGSYRHIINRDGSFIGDDLTEMIENLGDAHEALEECYDMIQYLTGGDKHRIAVAWFEGHLRPRRPNLSPEEANREIAEYWNDEC